MTEKNVQQLIKKLSQCNVSTTCNWYPSIDERVKKLCIDRRVNLPKSKLRWIWIVNSGETVNPVESRFILPVEDHPEGIPRAERDDRWEAAMGGIAGIIVTQFASLRAARTTPKLERNWVTSAGQEARIDNRTRCTLYLLLIPCCLH